MSSQDRSTGCGDWAQARSGFLASFDRTGSATVSAAELGSNRNTAFGWARAAGLPSNRQRAGHPGRGEYHRLRAAGVSRRSAAAAVGVHPRTAQDWDNGIRQINGSRLHPEGRRVDHTSGLITHQPVPPALKRWCIPGS